MNEKISSRDIVKYLDKDLSIELPQILTFDELDSTNNYLLENAKYFEQANVACFAESQTAGRGRLGRTWVSPAEANIYMSLLWHFQLTRSEIAGLNIVIGTSIIDALSSVTKIADYKLKWPNDIYYNDKKLAGVLIETVEEVNNITAVIIGIGINVNMPDTITDNDITKPWIDLATVSGKSISRNEIAAALLTSLTQNIRIFELDGADAFAKQSEATDYLKNKIITVNAGQSKHTGTANGIDSTGHLKLITSDDEEIQIAAGEASVV